MYVKYITTIFQTKKTLLHLFHYHIYSFFFRYIKRTLKNLGSFIDDLLLHHTLVVSEKTT